MRRTRVLCVRIPRDLRAAGGVSVAGAGAGRATPLVRVHPCGAHVIVYLAMETGDVPIVGIRYGREDWVGNPAGGIHR